MSRIVYDDEDNAPMTDDAFDGPHNPTVYTSYAEMRAAEKPLPFSDPPEHEDGCWNCLDFNGDYCTIFWKHLDESYKIEDRDAKEPDDWCPSWRKDPDAVWEDYHGTDS